jgi:hypothetical protein
MYAGTADFYGNTSEGGIGRTSLLDSTQPDGTGVGFFFGSALFSGMRTGHLISHYRKPQSPLLLKDITFMIYADIDAEEEYPMIAADTKLEVFVYKLFDDLLPSLDGSEPDWRTALRWNENDEIINELIGQGEVYGTQIIPDPTEPDFIGYLRFPFVKEYQGWLLETYLVIEDAFAIVVKGMDQDGIRFGTFTDRDNDIDRRSFFTGVDQATGMLDRNPRHNQPSQYNAAETNLNMYLMLKVHFPYLFIEPGQDTFEVPASGGLVNGTEGLKFFSEFDFEENDGERFVWYDGMGHCWIDGVDYDAPDWLTVTTSSHYMTLPGGDVLDYLKLHILAEALPAGVAGRRADIKVWAYGHSAEIEFTIIQGVVYEINFSVKDEYGNEIDDAIITIDGKELSSYKVYLPTDIFEYSVSKEGYITVEDILIVSGDATIDVVLVENVGIKEFNISSLILSPNPFTNEINISNPAWVKSVQIMNLAGQRVRGTSLRGGTIETGELSSGVYFVIIESVNGEKAVHKMVKK